MVSVDDGKIDYCLKQLSETQTYIKEKVSELKVENERLLMETHRKDIELKREKAIHDKRVAMEREELAREREDFEEMKKEDETVLEDGKTHMVELNVGGDKFTTDIRTLLRHKDSIFPRLLKDFDRSRPLTKVFVDRDSKHFRFILNYMRQGEEVFRCTALRGKDALDIEEMICEARYYRLSGFMKLLERHRVRLVHKVPVSFMNLVTNKFFKSPTTQNQPFQTTKQLTFKGENMEGMVFENVYFTYRVSFEHSILSNAKFKHCTFCDIVDFTNAEISNVLFDHCDKATPDRFLMDGREAEKCRVTFNPPVDLRQFSITYTTH